MAVPLKIPITEKWGARVGVEHAHAFGVHEQKSRFEPAMLRIEPGGFEMGAPLRARERCDDEGPIHGVHFSRAFELSCTPVTCGQFLAFVRATGRDMGSKARVYEGGIWKTRPQRNWLNPGFQQTEDHPVVCVNWPDAQAYCDWLAAETGRAYRLPTEAEWEYAARAGTDSIYAWGDEWDPAQANADRQEGGTVPVGRYPANPWGLHDMAGNIWEWCADHWHADYDGAPQDGSAWLYERADPGISRVVRGGSWFDEPVNLRMAVRYNAMPRVRSSDLGFRIARTVEDEPSV